MHSFKAIGLLEATEPIVINEWTDLVRTALAQKLGTPVPAGPASLLSAFSDALPAQHVSALVDALQWLALVPAMPSSAHAHAPASASTAAPPRIPRAPLPSAAARNTSRLRICMEGYRRLAQPDPLYLLRK